MDINEFSIACKLINLKLRGFDIPKQIPLTLLASLKGQTPPAIPPLPNSNLVSAPPRPEPPKAAPLNNQVPLMQSQPPVQNLSSGGLLSQASVSSSVIPTGVVPPLQSTLPSVPTVLPTVQNNLTGIQTTLPNVQQPLIGSVPPLSQSLTQSISSQPIIPGVNPPSLINQNLLNQQIPVQPTLPQMGIPSVSVIPQQMNTLSGFTAPILPNIGITTATGAPINSSAPPLTSSIPKPPLANTAPTSSVISGTAIASSTISTIPHTSPVGIAATLPSVGPGATSTPRASVTSIEGRAPSIESPYVFY